MTAPQLTAYVNGPNAIGADQLNTLMQTCDNASELRGLVGVPGLSVFLRGIAATNDGLGGTFYWNSTSTGPDDDLNTVQPYGVLLGAWSRLTTPIAQSITNIASLRALLGPTGSNNLTVYVTGYVTGGDGGGGEFWYNPADTTSADNGGTIFVDASHRRWYREAGGTPLNLLWFGGNSVSDYAPLLRLALAALPAPGGKIVYPAGKYAHNSLVTFNYPSGLFALTIEGCGADSTELTCPTTGGLVLNMTIPQHTIHLRDFTISCSTSGTQTGIQINNSTPQGIFGQNDIDRVTVRGADAFALQNYWQTGISIVGAGNFNIDGCLLYGKPGSTIANSLGTGLSIAGLSSGSSPYGIVYNILNTSFWEMGTPIVYGNNVQGVSISSCNFTNTVSGVTMFAGAVGGAQLAIVNSQFNVGGDAIVIAGNNNSLLLSNNVFFQQSAGTAAVGMTPQSTFSAINITGNEFINFSAAASVTAIDLLGTNEYGVLANNYFQGFAVGISLGTSTNHINVQSNEYVNVTTAVTNSGTSNTIGGGSS